MPETDRAASPRTAAKRWLRARIVDIRAETRTAHTLVVDVPGWPGHDAGQHLDVRLTAADGYQAQRSYSLASAGAPDQLELTVQRVIDGEVSPYLVDVAEVGDEFEVRGPIGRWFRWTPGLAGPVTLVGGGSGIVPLMAMTRARLESLSDAPLRVLYATRTPDHVFYAHELFLANSSDTDLQVSYAFSRDGLPDDTRTPGRVRAADVSALRTGAGADARVYICGPSGFVESVSQLFIADGHPAEQIRTERFGPTGL